MSAERGSGVGSGAGEAVQAVQLAVVAEAHAPPDPEGKVPGTRAAATTKMMMMMMTSLFRATSGRP